MSGGWSGLLAKTVVVGAISYGFPELTGVALSTAAIETLFGDLTQSGVDRWTEGDDTGDLDTVMAGAAAAVEEAARAHGIGEEEGRTLLAAVLTLVHRAGFAADRVVAAGYSPAALADAIIAAKPAVYEPLTERQRDLLRILLTAAIRGGLDTPESLASAGTAFRRAVLERTGAIDATTRRLPQETARETVALLRRLAVGAMLLPNRPTPYDPTIDSANVLLGAEFELVGLVGRDAMLAELTGWCLSEAPLGIRLYVGTGGMGKTRLFREHCRAMAEAGWLAGFMDPKLSPTASEDLAHAVGGHAGALVVVDYADMESRAAHTQYVLEAARLVAQQRAGRIRIVLIARGQDDWWTRFRQQSEDRIRSMLAGPAAERLAMEVPALELDDRRRLLNRALDVFATRLNRARPSDAGIDLRAGHMGHPLSLHMVALAMVEDGGVAAGVKRFELLDWVLDRQRRLWARCVGGDLGLGRACAQAVAVVHAAQGIRDPEAARRLLRKLPLLESETERVRLRVLEVLRAQHPGPHYLNGLTPDAIGDHLFQLELMDEPLLFELAYEFGGPS